jgi:hypothetical protein
MSLGTAAWERFRETGFSHEAEQANRLEVLAELASGQLTAVGLRADGLPEAVPPSLWVYAEIGEISPYPPWRSQGEVVVDFRCDAVAAWEPTIERYRVLYSDIRVSSVEAEVAAPAGVTNEPPGPKLETPSGKVLCTRYAEAILNDPLPADAPKRGARGFKTWLAGAVHERITAAGWAYNQRSIERILRELKIG